MVILFTWFYNFDSILFLWDCTDPWNFNWFLNCLLAITFFMIYDIILFIRFAKRFWIFPFPFNIMSFIANIIKDCYSILFKGFTRSTWMHCYPFTTFSINLYYSLMAMLFWRFKRHKLVNLFLLLNTLNSNCWLVQFFLFSFLYCSCN